MMQHRRTPSTLRLGEGAQRYFRQFLGEPTHWSPAELSSVTAVEGQDKDQLVETGERAYKALRGPAGQTDGPEEAPSAPPGRPSLGPPELGMVLYAAAVSAVAQELEMETPAQARAARGLALAEETPGLYHEHLLLVGRFTMDVLQGPHPPDSFGGLVEVVVDRLSSLVELASQSMMGGEVDPFETFEHRDCEACGHLLQRHVGFESWDDVYAEHRRWCPGAKGR